MEHPICAFSSSSKGIGAVPPRHREGIRAKAPHGIHKALFQNAATLHVRQRVANDDELVIQVIGQAILRQYRTNELVRRRMNFSSDAMADFEGLLEVNRKICKQQMAEKASPTLPTNCAVLP